MWDHPSTSNGGVGRSGPRTKRKMREHRAKIEAAKKQEFPRYQAQRPRMSDDDAGGGTLASPQRRGERVKDRF